MKERIPICSEQLSSFCFSESGFSELVVPSELLEVLVWFWFWFLVCSESVSSESLFSESVVSEEEFSDELEELFELFGTA